MEQNKNLGLFVTFKFLCESFEDCRYCLYYSELVACKECQEGFKLLPLKRQAEITNEMVQRL